MDEKEADTDRIDEAVLALMYLGFHNEDQSTGTGRAWKRFYWDALDRLHAEKLIADPVSDAKSVF